MALVFGAVLLLLAGGAGEVLAQGRANRPKRSPRHADRQTASAAAVARLREATAPNWRVLGDTVVGTPLWADFTAGAAALPAVLRVGSPRAAVATFLARHGDLWGGAAAPGTSLRLLSEKVDERGGVHFMYQQVYRGVDVEGAELGFFANRGRDGRYFIETVFGRFHPDIDVDVTPALAAADAKQRLILAVDAEEPIRDLVSRLGIMLVQSEYRLIWRVEIRASNGAWGAQVDALTGEVLRTFSVGRSLAARSSIAALSIGGGEPKVRAHGWGPAGEQRLLGAGSATAMRASCIGINVFGQEVDFGCLDQGSFYQLRDQTNPSSSEIRVYNGSILTFSSDADGDWEFADQHDEASAMETANLTLDHYRAKYNRDNMKASSGTVLDVVARTTELRSAGFDEDDGQYWLTFYEGGTGYYPFHWTTTSMTWKATAGGKSLFAHEFQHGVNFDEGAASSNSTEDAKAIDEALADYFAFAWTEDPCLGNEIIDSPNPLSLSDGSPDSTSAHPGCGRHVEPDIHIQSSWASHLHIVDNDTTTNFHERGQVATSALWDVRDLIGGPVAFDSAVYRAVRFYIRSTPTFIEVREGVVKAIKDLEHDNRFSAGIRPSNYTEWEFHENGVGPAALKVTLDYDSLLDLWQATVEGPANTSFNARMYAGTGYNNDGSVSGQFDAADNDPSFATGATGTVTFYPGQQGWVGLRDHYPGDANHEHSVRVRVATESGCCGGIFSPGQLYYFDGYDNMAWLELNPNVVAGGIENTGDPTRFALRQVLRSADAGRLRSLNASVVESSAAPSSGAWDPRSGITHVAVSVPAAAQRARVLVRIYDLAGRLVREAVNDWLEPGEYVYAWDGKDAEGRKLPPGVYIAVMEAPGYRGTSKLVLTR